MRPSQATASRPPAAGTAAASGSTTAPSPERSGPDDPGPGDSGPDGPGSGPGGHDPGPGDPGPDDPGPCGRNRGRVRAATSASPQAARTITSHGPTVAAATPPATRYAIQRPCAARVPRVTPARPPPARRDQAHRGGHGHRRHGRARSGRRTRDPSRRAGRQEEGREPEDDDQPGDDEADPAEDRAGRTAQPPGAEDGQLGRGGPGQQVAGGQPVLEVVRRQPLPVRHAQLAQQRDVRGRPAEPDAADPAPFPDNRGQRDRPGPGGALLAAQRDQARGQPTQRR